MQQDIPISGPRKRTLTEKAKEAALVQSKRVRPAAPSTKAHISVSEGYNHFILCHGVASNIIVTLHQIQKMMNLRTTTISSSQIFPAVQVLSKLKLMAATLATLTTMATVAATVATMAATMAATLILISCVSLMTPVKMTFVRYQLKAHKRN